MKSIFIFLAFTLALGQSTNNIEEHQPHGTCGGECSSSAKCAYHSGDINCRCTFMTCGLTDTCGGGCVLDSQCYQWSGENSDCVCTFWFECDLKKNIKNPGYKPLLKLAAMAKQGKKGFNAAAASYK